jgi:8-oxo-dGTP diphosphatase
MTSVQDRFSINVVVNARNEVLLLKRGVTTTIGPGRWGLPAGHNEAGESPEDCSIRELEEEIGTDHRVELVRKLGPIRDTCYGGIYQIYLFHYRWHEGMVRLNREHTACAWVGKRDYKNYDVVAGVDEDLFYLNIWPRRYLNEALLPGSHPPRIDPVHQ